LTGNLILRSKSKNIAIFILYNIKFTFCRGSYQKAKYIYKNHKSNNRIYFLNFFNSSLESLLYGFGALYDLLFYKSPVNPFFIDKKYKS